MTLPRTAGEPPTPRPLSAAQRVPIPMSEWLWHGHAGHLIVSHDCEFHLNTRVGDYRISTIGNWFPRDWPEFESLSEIDSEAYNDCEDATAGHLAMCHKYARLS